MYERSPFNRFVCPMRNSMESWQDYKWIETSYSSMLPYRTYSVFILSCRIGSRGRLPCIKPPVWATRVTGYTSVSLPNRYRTWLFLQTQIAITHLMGTVAFSHSYLLELAFPPSTLRTLLEGSYFSEVLLQKFKAQLYLIYCSYSLLPVV